MTADPRMSDNRTVYVSIGNSDDKLTQNEWAHFYTAVHGAIERHAHRLHGRWLSEPSDPWQNACWCIEVPAECAEPLRAALRLAARAFGQDSIAWAEATTEFLAPHGGEMRG